MGGTQLGSECKNLSMSTSWEKTSFLVGVMVPLSSTSFLTKKTIIIILKLNIHLLTPVNWIQPKLYMYLYLNKTPFYGFIQVYFVCVLQNHKLERYYFGINKWYCSRVSYLHMLGLSTCRRSRGGNNNITNFSCLFPLWIEVSKVNEVIRGTNCYMIYRNEN